VYPVESLRSEFFLELSTGFVYDVLRDRVEQLDLAAHRRMVLKRFNGGVQRGVSRFPLQSPPPFDESKTVSQSSSNPMAKVIKLGQHVLEAAEKVRQSVSHAGGF
jgi:hypothetical protein